MIGLLAAVCIVAVLAVQIWGIDRMRKGSTSVDPHDATPTGEKPAVSRPGPAPTNLVDRLALAMSRNQWMRKGLSIFTVFMVLLAVGIAGQPFFTNLLADRLQDNLTNQFASDELRQDYEQCQQVGIESESCRIRSGDSLTRIEIKDINVDVVVVEGVGANALRAGAGHYPSTPLPCEPGNVGIAGHRTTYGRPFNNLDRLVVGQSIILHTPLEQCTYRVTEMKVVAPSDVSVIQDHGRNELTLTTCNPKGSARERLIIHAELVGTAPITPPASAPS